MKMKKRIITGAAAMMMAGVMMIPVQATDITESGSKTETTTVEYSQNSTWTVSIPKTTLSQSEEVIQTVSASKMDIRPEQKLQVKITGITDGKVTLTRNSSDSVTTTVTVSSGDENTKTLINGETVIAEFEDQSTSFANNTTGKLYFSKVSEDTYAGDYTGTITYTMETVNK